MNADVALPPLGPAGWARWAWRRLTSMSTALLLLMLLAVAAVPGSVLPQRRIDPARVSAYLTDHPRIGPWLDRLGGFDVYASVWFSAIYLLLFISLLGCLVPRARQHVANLRSRPPRTPRHLDRLPEYHRVEGAGRPAAALEAAHAALRARRYRIAEHDGGTSLAAEKGYTAETGNIAFHLALLGVLVAVAIGSLFGYSGQAVVVTGHDFANALPRYDSFRAGTRVPTGELAPFWFTLDDLQVRFEQQAGGNQFGAPRDFRADLTVHARPDDAGRHQVLQVNHPVSVDGVRVFLIGNGYAPQVTVRDGTGRVAFAGAVPFLARDSSYTSTGVIKVPDARPSQLGLAGVLLPTAALTTSGMPVSVFPDLGNPRLLLTGYTGDLGLDSGVPKPVYQLDTSKLHQLTSAPGQPFRAMLAPGESVRLPGGVGSVAFDGVRRYAALDVRHDPSDGWALAAGMLTLAGLVASLFVRRRRVWVRVSGDDGATVVEAAGLARGEDPGLAAEVAAVIAAVTPAVGTKAVPAPSAAETGAPTGDPAHDPAHDQPAQMVRE